MCPWHRAVRYEPSRPAQVFLYLQEKDLFGGMEVEAAAGAEAEPEVLQVEVPAGAGPGDVLALEVLGGGEVLEVAVPACAQSGDRFEVVLSKEAPSPR